MKLKLVSLMLCALIFTQGCALIKAEESKMEKTYTIADFTKVKIGMTYDEVIELVGVPIDSIGSGIVWQRYKLDEGWYIKLLFMGETEALIDIRIVDYPNDREFELKQYE